MKRLTTILILLLLILAIPSAVVAAGRGGIIKDGDTLKEDVVLTGDTLLIEAGGTLDGDLTIFGGSADVAGSVTGDVALIGGTLDLSGTVTGDLVVFGGALEVAEDAALDGDCVLFGSDVTDASDSVTCASFGSEFNLDELSGRISPPQPPEPPPPPDPSVEVDPPQSSFFGTIGHFLLRVGEVIGRSLLLGLIALVLGALAPTHLGQVGDAIRRKPVASGTVGLLTAVAVPSLGILLLIVSAILVIVCIGLLGFPLVLALFLALAAGGIFGWVAMGSLLGKALLNALDMTERNLAVTAALGTIILTLIAGGLGLLPFVFGEGLLVSLVAMVGLGATALTQFGTKPYPPGSAPAADSAKVDAVLETMPPEETK